LSTAVTTIWNHLNRLGKAGKLLGGTQDAQAEARPLPLQSMEGGVS
jgi:hypothetical protein